MPSDVTSFKALITVKQRFGAMIPNIEAQPDLIAVKVHQPFGYVQ